MGQLALKNDSEYTDSEKAIVFHQPKEDYIMVMNKVFKLFNSIEKMSDDFRRDIAMANTKEALDLVFVALKMNLGKL